MLVALAVMGWMSLEVGALQGFHDDIHITARFDDASGLTKGTAVKVAGVEVGRVTALAVDYDQAVVSMDIAKSANLRKDVVAQVRARSVLGEKYVALLPQSRNAPPLEDGDRITHTLGHTEIDELVNEMGPLVGSVDPDALRTALSSLSDALRENPDVARQMLDDAQTILHNGAEASKQLSELVTETRQTLADVREVARRAGSTIDRADQVIDRLDAATADLPQTLEETRGLIEDTRAGVADARQVLGDLQGSTGDLKKALSNLSEIDTLTLRKLLREDGILIRLKEHDIQPTEEHR